MMKRGRIMIFIIGLVVIGLILLGLKFNESNSEVVDETYSIVKFNQVDIDDSINSVEFKRSDHYCVRYHGKKDWHPTVSVNHDILKVKSVNNIVINDAFFNRKSNKQLLTIEMPEKELTSLKIDLSNGSVAADTLKVKEGSIDTSNGSIRINNLITVAGFKVDTSNGQVKVNHSNAKGYNLSTSNGEVIYNGKTEVHSYMKNKDVANVLNVNTSNGNIAVN